MIETAITCLIFLACKSIILGIVGENKNRNDKKGK
jgi:hypothetical protein